MSKRLDLICNGKGGVGKSFFATNFIQYLKDHSLKHVAIDTDNENSTLKRFHPDANFLDLSKPSTIDPIFAELNKHSLVVVDCRAASTDIFLRYFASLDAFDVLKKLDAALTVILPVNNDPDSLNQLQILIERFNTQARYVVVKNRFFGDQFAAAQSSNLGVHYVAANGNVPKDTDGDGVPDYVEDANGNGIVDFNTAENVNETDWQNPMTDGTNNDAYNVAYDDVDLSGDGIVGRIKKALGMNPFDASNPLVLTQIITGDEPRIATFEVPISYTLLTNIGRLNLIVDSVAVPAQESAPSTNGTCLLKWNTTFNSPGQHYLQAQLNLNGQIESGSTPAPTVLAGAGTLGLYNSTNICQFDPYYSTFAGNSAILYATTPTCPNANYTIDIQTATGQHIKTITNSTSTGVISESWDLTDDNGNPVTNNTFKAVFNVTLLDPNEGVLDFWFQRALSVTTDAKFTVAYAWDNATYANGSMKNSIQGGAVNSLLTPVTADGGNDDNYDSDFNRYTGQKFPDDPGNPGQLTSGSDITNLINNLADVDTMNFYFNGHGNPQAIGDNKNDSVTLSAVTVASTLDNWYSPLDGNWSYHPYRFVFLDACETANDDFWSHAFGINDSISSTNLENSALGAQAFVGWSGSPRAPNSDDEWNAYGQTLTVFYEAWMSGDNLQECIDAASQKNPYGDGSVILNFPLGQKFNFIQNYYGFRKLNGFKIKVYGYRGIKRDDWDDGY